MNSNIKETVVDIIRHTNGLKYPKTPREYSSIICINIHAESYAFA